MSGRLRRGILILGVALLALLAAPGRRAQAAAGTASKVPTVFLHGFASSASAEAYMVEGAAKAGITNDVMYAEVEPAGKVTLYGRMSSKSENPIVMVEFLDNRDIDYMDTSQWLRNVIVALQKRYRITKFNTVSHSLGNMAVMYYIRRFQSQPGMPRIVRQVAIAGNFSGRPRKAYLPGQITLQEDYRPEELSTYYRYLLPVQNIYRRDQIHVLNIYSSIDGEDSDGRVNNNSSRSLRYLVGPDYKNYQSVRIEGMDHHQIKRNRQVNRLINRFLWGRGLNAR